jgi:hypothetical protein
MGGSIGSMVITGSSFLLLNGRAGKLSTYVKFTLPQEPPETETLAFPVKAMVGILTIVPVKSTGHVIIRILGMVVGIAVVVVVVVVDVVVGAAVVVVVDVVDVVGAVVVVVVVVVDVVGAAVVVVVVDVVGAVVVGVAGCVPTNTPTSIPVITSVKINTNTTATHCLCSFLVFFSADAEIKGRSDITLFFF